MEPKKADVFNVTMVDLKNSQIDTDNKIIKHLSIIGTKAFDLSGNVFRTFTDEALVDAITVFNGALARIDHDKLSVNDVESRGVKSGYGIYQNLVREGDMVFGDLHLWDCEDARKVMSIAQRTPNAVGNSIHAGGKVRMGDDGVEIVERLLPTTIHGFKPSIDLVEDPAATVGLYQNKKINLDSERVKTMEFKDLTQESIVTNRPDLEKYFKDEGAASRDDEVKKIEQERDEANKRLDELEVKQARSEREITADRLLLESELPDYARTKIFRKQLLAVKEVKDGDKTVSIEDGMKSLIQDRIDSAEPGGVHDNDEKTVTQSKQSKSKVDADEFVDAFSANSYGG